jgi:hypothetical protein
MTDEKLLRIKKKSDGWSNGFVYRADAQLASQLPELAARCMDEGARVAFRNVRDYEEPASLADVLALAEARGFHAHPSDWLPYSDQGERPTELYQPWVDWLSEHGLTPFHEYNRLTEDNWNRWKPRPRLLAFKRLLRESQQSAFELLMTMAPAQSAATRLALLGEVNAIGSFAGNHPRQIPILLYFLGDRSEKVRAAAEQRLKKMGRLVTEEAHAAELAMHLKVSGGSVTYKTPPSLHSHPYTQNFLCTTFDYLAAALGLSPHDLARQSDLEELGPDFMLLVSTGDVDTRSIIAARLLDMGKDFSEWLFRGVARPLWERGLRATFDSEYYSFVGDYLGRERGTLDASQMRQLLCYKRLEQSVTDEVEHRKLPVNKQHDHLRAVGLVVNKYAAKEALEKALSLGMTADNPRLTMLKFNMAM